jgi:ABC-2 type transport system ATP-binding protein/lipopolysaccharide transport system ATP-binding protein
MYGLSRAQIDQRFNEIVSFAELEDFIDDPVRTYSSGMYMRLGFSVAIHTNPDILLIDEVLAVGDVAFIHKCHDIISEFRRRGKTLIFVTHDLNSVSKWCDEAIWLDKGEIKLRGEPKRVIDAYLQGVEDKQLEDLQKQNVEGQNQRRDPFDKRHSDDKRWGDKQVELSRVRISCASEEPKWLFHTNDQVVVEVDYSINEPIEDLVFGVGIVRADGLDIHGNNTALDSVIVPLPDFDSCKSFPMHGSFSYSIDRLALLEGTYYLDVAAHRGDGLAYDYHHQLHKFSVSGDSKKSGVYLPKTAWKIEPAYQAASASGRGVVQSEVEAYKVRRA